MKGRDGAIHDQKALSDKQMIEGPGGMMMASSLPEILQPSPLRMVLACGYQNPGHRI